MLFFLKTQHIKVRQGCFKLAKRPFYETSIHYIHDAFTLFLPEDLLLKHSSEEDDVKQK